MNNDQSPDELRALAYELICALEDSSLGERIRRIGVELVRRSYGQGRTRVEIVRQADLRTLTNVPDTYLKEGIGKLIEHQIVQAYPGTDFYEVLGKPADWRVGARCRLGFDGAADLRAVIDERNGPPEQQIGFDEKEDTFATDLIRRTIGDNSREDAARAARRQSSESTSGSACSHRSPQPGEGRERPSTHPPGIIRAEGGGVGERISLAEACRRSLRGEKVTAEVSCGDGTVLQPGQSTLPTSAKVTAQVTLPGNGAQPPPPKVSAEVTFGSEPGQKLPQRKLSSRAGASDDSSSSGHLYSRREIYLSSSSSDADDPEEDEGRRDDRCGVGKWQMVPMNDELLGDVRRALGDHMESFTWYWRQAIWGSRAGVAEALAAVKNKLPPADHPGRYLRRCFIREAQRRHIPLPLELLGRGGSGAGGRR